MKTAAIVVAGILTAAAAHAQTITKVPDNRHVPYYDAALAVHTAGRIRFMETRTDPLPDWCPATAAPPPLPVKKGKPVPPLPDFCMPPADWFPPPMEPAFAYGWPGVYFESRFTGDEVVVKLDDPTSTLDLRIDGVQVARFVTPGEAIYDVTGLDVGEHTVRLERVNEDLATGGVFGGFYVPVGSVAIGKAMPPPQPHNKATPLPSPGHARRIEFIGDSYLSGYGTTSLKRDCTADEIHATTDTQQAWGALTARHYDADYQVNATSGIGMVRNYDGGKSPAMPELYGSDLMGTTVTVHAAETLSGSPWTESATFRPTGTFGDDSHSPVDWQPQVIVIGLGDNDFATPPHTGEKWADLADLRGDFIDSYVAFLTDLRVRNPNATFILMDYGEPELGPDLSAIAAIAKARGDNHVLTWSAGTGFEQTGCDWHLSLNDHKRISDALIAFIDQQPGIWN